MTPKKSLVYYSLILLITVGLWGCAGRGASLEYSPEQFGKIGAEIHGKPEQADKILESHNLDREKFEESIEYISEVPGLAKRYREAFEQEMQD